MNLATHKNTPPERGNGVLCWARKQIFGQAVPHSPLYVLYICSMHETNQSVAQWSWLGSAAALALSLGTPVLAQAQEAPGSIRLMPEDAQRGPNGHQHNFYFQPPGASGDKYLNAGFFGQHLRPYLGAHSDALANLNLYKRQKQLFLADRIVAVGAFGVYGSQIFSHGEPVYFNGTQKVAAGVFVASLLATIFINQRTNSYIQRAVGSYNAGPSSGALWPRLQPSGIGVTQASTGQPLLALQWAVR